MTERPKTVLITGARAPVAMHLSALFSKAGWRTVLTDSFKHPISRFTHHCGHYERLPAPRSAFRMFSKQLRELVDKQNIDFILPTSEEIFYVAKAAEIHGFSDRVFAPGLDGLRAVHNKWTFSQIAENLPIKTPNTKLITAQAGLKSAQRQGKIFKPVWSRFGDHVLFCPTAKALATLPISKSYPWISQDLVKGTEYCLYAVCYHGKLTAMSAYEPTWRAGQGAGIYFQPFQHSDLTKFVSEFAIKTKWHGQVSFDFIRDKQRKFHVLECNPRAVSGLHFFTAPDNLVMAMTSGQSISAPTFQNPLCSKLAMKIYGLPIAIKQKNLSSWRADMQLGIDILKHAQAAKLGRAQTLFMLEIIGRARRMQSSLITASTYDIEWNGEDIK